MLTSALAACGGNFVPGDGSTDTDSGPDGSGGSVPSDDGVGGSTGGVTGGTGGGSTGGVTGGTGGAECCLAFPVCDGADKQVESETECPIDVECYSRTACCSTIWCMPEQPACDGIPTCLDDETVVGECPSDATCTVRSLCGSVIVCQLNDGVCDPQREHDRDYVGESPENCAVIDYTCPEHTVGFSNDCGCGCEQPSECPEFVDCSPGSAGNPLCSSAECPYTTRAQ